MYLNKICFVYSSSALSIFIELNSRAGKPLGHLGSPTQIKLEWRSQEQFEIKNKHPLCPTTFGAVGRILKGFIAIFFLFVYDCMGLYFV